MCQSCPPDSDPDPCGKCIGEHCCDNLDACLGSADCQALASCIQGCPAGSQCETQCYLDHPDGSVLLNQANVCGLIQCRDVCGFATPCTDCRYTACLSQNLDCAMNADCLHYLDCIGACAVGDNACFDACGAAHPEGMSLQNAEASCTLSACATECPIG